MIKITEGIYVETEYPGANVGCVMTEHGVVMIDTPMLPEEAQDLRDQLGQMGQPSMAYIIYTHQHFDHVMGSAFLTRRTIACSKAVNGIKYLEDNLGKEVSLFFPEIYQEKKEIIDRIEIVTPQITFSDQMTLHMGNKTIQMTFVAGHSSASILSYVPEDRILFAGDNVVTGSLPVTANCRFGTWIELLENIENMDIDVIIPGHGDPAGKEAATSLRTYFEALRDRVRPLASAGMSKESVVQKVDLADSLPVSPSDEATLQTAYDVSVMYDQIAKGLL